MIKILTIILFLTLPTQAYAQKKPKPEASSITVPVMVTISNALVLQETLIDIQDLDAPVRTDYNSCNHSYNAETNTYMINC